MVCDGARGLLFMFLNNELSFAFMTTWFLCGTGNNGKERKGERRYTIIDYGIFLWILGCVTSDDVTIYLTQILTFNYQARTSDRSSLHLVVASRDIPPPRASACFE